MKMGIFGSASDCQCAKLRTLLEEKGCEVVTIESQGLNQGENACFDGVDFIYGGKNTRDVKCWFLRYVMSPLPPAFRMEDQYYLYADWFIEYMRRRERFAFQLSWLFTLCSSGIPILNPPEHGSVVQLKPFQIQAAHRCGLNVPKTLITNDPKMVLEFAKEVGEVVFKPSMGGGLCQVLDAAAMEQLETISASPVTFQEKIQGKSVRLTLVGDSFVSAVIIPSECLDYRADPAYFEGKVTYEAIDIPGTLVDTCRALMKTCGLLFAGIDFILKSDGTFVFLEANSSPIYFDIEEKMGHRITNSLADLMLKLANEPEWYKTKIQEFNKTQTFVQYAFPFL